MLNFKNACFPLLVIGSVLCYSLGVIAQKWCFKTLPVYEVLFIHNLLQIIALTLCGPWTQLLPKSKIQFRQQAILALLGTLGFILCQTAVSILTNVAFMTSILALLTFIIPLLGHFVSKEHIQKPLMFSAFAFSTIGLVILVIRPYESDFHIKDFYGSLVGFAAVLCLGPYFLFLRKYDEKPIPTTFLTRLTTFILLGIMVLIFQEEWTFPNAKEWGVIVSAGLGFLFGVILRILGFAKNTPACAAILANWQIVFDLLFQSVILKVVADTYRILAAIGLILVVSIFQFLSMDCGDLTDQKQESEKAIEEESIIV